MLYQGQIFSFDTAFVLNYVIVNYKVAKNLPFGLFIKYLFC